MTVARSGHTEPRSVSDDRLDSELLRRIGRGDRNALIELYGRYYHPLLRFLQRLIGEIDSAEEGVNDVMLVVWQKANSFGGRSKVRTWIMGIAYRKAMRHRASLGRWNFRFKAADWADAIEPTAGTEGQITQLVTQDLLRHALLRLSPKHRAVVELTYYHEFSYEEIAEIIGCPENTVKTRMFHARKKLKKLLPELGHRFEDD